VDPHSETRGTCPHCEQRVRVSVPRNGDGSARLCGRHLLPSRARLGRADPVCPGTRCICLEDRRKQ
jgi:hypothetical protein